MTTRLANVDLRGDTYYVCTYSRTDAGFWVSEGAPIVLAASASAGELGSAVREALDRSQEGLQTPPADADLTGPLLAAAGAATYASYAKTVRQIGVRTTEGPDGETVQITPKNNGGGRTGFTPMKDQQTKFLYDSPGQVGEAVMNALELATA